MPVRLIPFESDGFYHIYNRSTERIRLFRSATDYHFFISKMLLLGEQMQIEIPIWAALPTHFHQMAIQRGEVTISLLQHRLCTSYATYYNRKYQRKGYLFESRFKAKLITSDEYLTSLAGYIENNPIHHGLVTRIEDWPFTSRFVGNPVINKPEKHNDFEFEEMELLKQAG